MGLYDIIRIIQSEDLCRNWDLDDEEDVPQCLNCYLKGFTLIFCYENRYLYTIIETVVDSDYHHIVKSYLKNSIGQVFLYDDRIYIQTKYKRFNKNVFLEQVALYHDMRNKIRKCNYEDQIKRITLRGSSWEKVYKKYKFYKEKNINIQTDQIWNYPLLNNQ